MVKAILFDVDGTLIDSNDAHAQAWVDAFAEAGHTIPFAVVRGQIGKGGDNLVPALLPGTSEEATEALGEGYGRAYKERYLGGVRAFPAVCALFGRLRSDGIQVVLASSAEREALKAAIAIIGCGDLLADTISSEDAERSKPDPDIFAAALAKLAPAAPEEVLVVGDTPYDVRAAAKCGLRTVAVTCGGFDPRALEEAGAITLYRDPADLLANYDRFLAS